MLLPLMTRKFPSKLALVITAVFADPLPPVAVPGRHLKLTWIAAWLPSAVTGQPTAAGFEGTLVRFWLVPPGPVTKIRKVFPALAVPKLKWASIRLLFSTVNFTAWKTLFGFPCSTAKTLVTPPMMFGPPATNCVKEKQAPLMSRFCKTPQSPSDGVTEITTGALVPRFKAQVVALVKAPNSLLSPAEKVVVTVTV